jgi:hypothetical protein
MPSRWSGRRARFRAPLEGGDACTWARCMTRSGVGLGGSRLLNGHVRGFVTSLAAPGVPDLIVLTLSKFADQAYRIGPAADLPLMVDADQLQQRTQCDAHGGELETAGATWFALDGAAPPTRKDLFMSPWSRTAWRAGATDALVNIKLPGNGQFADKAHRCKLAREAAACGNARARPACRSADRTSQCGRL